jgi:hypothetical protein
MSQLRVQPVDTKTIRISGIEPFLADCLETLGETLEQRDSPRASGRLFPPPTADSDKANEDWQKFVDPDLRHLFVSAGETVLRDLTGLQPEAPAQPPASYQVTFSAQHANAWISALNQARLILGELFHITEEDMNKTRFDVTDERTLAIVRIHLLGYLLHLFVEMANPETGGDGPKTPV